MLLSLLGSPVFAQSFYRPWQSYKPVRPQKLYENIGNINTSLVQKTCLYNGNYYEPNEFFTKDLDISKEETFQAFKECCSRHISRCVSHYIGSNNQTLLYTMVEHNAYNYMRWILTDGLVYETNVDQWGIYKQNGKNFIPIRNYNPMMLACIRGDLTAAKILRENGAYLTKPENAIKQIPYFYATQHKEDKPDFFNYIKAEYSEELKNISIKKQYGETFSINDGILQKFIDYLEENFYKNQLRILEKVKEMNKA